jgi:hypothetical protein
MKAETQRSTAQLGNPVMHWEFLLLTATKSPSPGTTHPR